VTYEAVDRMSEQTARNILSALDGEPIRQNVINQEILGPLQVIASDRT
jgi:D-3-phosphoglycerate dehydrogenase